MFAQLKLYGIVAAVVAFSALACFCAIQTSRLTAAKASVDKLEQEVADRDALIDRQKAAAYLLEEALNQREADLAAASAETERLRGSYASRRGTVDDPLVSPVTKSLLEEMSR